MMWWFVPIVIEAPRIHHPVPHDPVECAQPYPEWVARRVIGRSVPMGHGKFTPHYQVIDGHYKWACTDEERARFRGMPKEEKSAAIKKLAEMEAARMIEDQRLEMKEKAGVLKWLRDFNRGRKLYNSLKRNRAQTTEGHPHP